MKKLSFLFACIAICFVALAQKSPVSLSYTAKKKADNSYDIIITATIEKGWHIYSQTTGKGGPIATSISFKPNPLVVLNGKVKEVGKLEKNYDKLFKVNVAYFSDKVEFVQNVKLKAAAKTAITGTIEYMTCDDSECQPPKKINFEVKL